MFPAAFDVFRQDLRYACRSIARTPGFAVLVVLTFTLGFGVNAAAFSVLDTIFLKPPAGVARPSELRRIWHSFRGEGGQRFFAQSLNGRQYLALADVAGPGVQLALYHGSQDRLRSVPGQPSVNAMFATASYFRVLGVRPALGRFYTTDEDRIGGAPVVVLSDRSWRSHFGRDPAIIGKRIRVGEETYTVIGVAPRAFTGIDLKPADLWIPLRVMPRMAGLQEHPFESVRLFVFFAIARTPAGFDIQGFERRATLHLRELGRELSPAHPDTAATIVTGSIIAARGAGKPAQESLIATRLAGVAAIVLLIACANVVNLLLARAVRRRREIAVRLALGMSRARLAGLLVTETLLLALAGGITALLAASWAGALLRAMLIPDAAPAPDFDPRITAFTLGVAMLAGLFAGMIPALQASNPRLTHGLTAGSGDGMAHRSRLRNSLVVVQAALSVVLLVGAALFVRSLQNVEGLDIGYDADRLVFGSVQFDRGLAPPDAVLGATIEQISARLASYPGVERIARAGIPPMRGFSAQPLFADDADTNATRTPTYTVVSASYFATVGMRLLRGSVFDDRSGAPNTIMVNDAMVKSLWRGRDPLGKCVRFAARDNPCYTVIGVVETARRGGIIEEPAPQYYVPLNHAPEGGWEAPSLIVRARERSVAAAERELLSALRAAFPTGMPHVRTMIAQLEPEYRPWRLGARLFTAFGLLALVVALVGIYSAVSYSVSQRTHEFAIRIAVGAQVRDVLTLVVGEGTRLVAVGVAVGIALALGAGRLLAATLYGVEPSDPRAMMAAASTMLVVALVAALIPAWRAARVDPNVALRAD